MTLARAMLLYWLGPWAPRRLPRVARREVAAGVLYAPVGRVRGAWLVSPGLSPDGPDDPRLDRLARVLAASGCVVLSPRVATLMRLELRAAAIDDLRAAFEVLAVDGVRPGVFSVSVGSLAALRLAADPRVSRCVTFGGYADPVAMIGALTADPARLDPLNRPLAMLTVLDDLPLAQRTELADAWRRYLRIAWARPAWKRAGSLAHVPLAHELATALAPPLRALFLVGCGAAPGATEVAERAYAAADRAYLDPRLAQVRCPVHVVHARGDNVIPFAQAEQLAAAIPGAQLYPLGAYGHSKIPTLTDWRRAASPWRDVHTLGRLTGALARPS